jgi:hypothetical protein
MDNKTRVNYTEIRIMWKSLVQMGNEIMLNSILTACMSRFQSLSWTTNTLKATSRNKTSVFRVRVGNSFAFGDNSGNNILIASTIESRNMIHSSKAGVVSEVSVDFGTL